MSAVSSRVAELSPSAPNPHSPAGKPSAPSTTFFCATGVMLLALCFFCPRFWLWPVAGLPLGEMVSIQPELHRAFHALRQLEDPWMRVDDPVNRVIEWRLLWPVVAHQLGFSKNAYLGMPFVGCWLTLVFVAAVGWRSTRAALPAVSITLLAATSSWFFVSTGWLAYFDSWLVLGLLLASFARARGVLFAAALLAPWIDERFILALPLCLAVRSLSADLDSPRTRRELLRDGAALVVGIAPYIAVRLGAELNGTRATSGSYWTDRPVLPAPWLAMGWGAWNGLRLGWLVLVPATVAAFRLRRHRLAIAVIALTLAINLCVADDISRSTSILLPVLIAGGVFAWRHASARTQRFLPLLCIGNLILPAQHVIAAPGTAVAYHLVPILAADAEFERARHPPEFANSATYTRRSLDHFQNQALERALAAADIAVRFDPKNAKAVANRAILLYVTGKTAEGGAELDRALQSAPELYDARMQRAAFRQQAGDLRGALDDVRQALRYMPPDWPRRSDAQQFERALAAKVGR